MAKDEFIGKFNIREEIYDVFYNDKEISVRKNNEKVLRFENRKEFFYFINQLTDCAELIKEKEE